jgi:thiamine biosynthesis lipoprotein
MRPASGRARRGRPLLGTFVEIAAEGASSAAVDTAVDAAFRAVSLVHRLMSFHDPASDVGRLNRHAWARPVAVHPWTHAVLRAAIDLGRASAGVFDVAVAPALQRMGRLPGSAPPPHPPPAGADPDGTIELLPSRRVRFGRRDVGIDLGGIAKGFAVDRALDTLRRHGMTRGRVNAGGDLAVFGAPGETISIRDPRDPGAILGHVAVRDAALASSGGGDAAIIDPRRAAPATAIRGATVRAPACVLADALTKIVTIAGEQAAPILARYGASALFLSADGQVHITRDWAAQVQRAS